MLAESQIPVWVRLCCAAIVFLITAALGYWQLRRNEESGVACGDLPLSHAMVFVGQGIVAVGAVAMLSESREGGPRPELAVVMALFSIAVQALCLRRLRGRLPEMVGLACSFALACLALIYAFVKHYS